MFLFKVSMPTPQKPLLVLFFLSEIQKCKIHERFMALNCLILEVGLGLHLKCHDEYNYLLHASYEYQTATMTLVE